MSGYMRLDNVKSRYVRLGQVISLFVRFFRLSGYVMLFHIGSC